MNIFGLVFSRVKESEIGVTEKAHEQIHTIQQYEIFGASAIVALILCNIFASWWYLLGVLAIPFVIYVLGWLIEIFLPPYHNISLNFEKGEGVVKKFKKIMNFLADLSHDAYRDNCFEREAYANEGDLEYFINRPFFGWMRYIIKSRSR